MPAAQLYEDARDNYKILRTLERHFSAIAGSPVPGIPQMLLPMFNALRLVWAISTHYSDDTHMCALLQRIANAVCDRAQQNIVIQARPQSPELPAELLQALSNKSGCNLPAQLSPAVSKFEQLGVGAIKAGSPVKAAGSLQACSNGV